MSHRSPGEGSISQRSGGLWQASLQVNGARRTVYARSEREVRRKLRELQKEANLNGALSSPGKRTLDELLNLWLETAKPNLRPSTVEGYEKVIRIIRPALGSVRLSKLEPVRIQQFYTQLQARGVRIPSRAHTVLHLALGVAVQWGWLSFNPTDRTAKPRYRAARKEVWNTEELARFLEGTAGHPLHPFFVVAIASGCRLGELIGLRWDDVDWQGSAIAIRQSLQWVKGRWVIGQPKTETSLRHITLPAVAMDALKKQRAQQNAWKLRTGASWPDTGLVFTTLRGTPLGSRTPERALQAWCARLGIRPMTPHQMRHLSASLLLAQKIPITAVSARLGHASPAVTAQVYSHAIQGQDRVAAQTIGEVLEGCAL